MSVLLSEFVDIYVPNSSIKGSKPSLHSGNYILLSPIFGALTMSKERVIFFGGWLYRERELVVLFVSHAKLLVGLEPRSKM